MRNNLLSAASQPQISPLIYGLWNLHRWEDESNTQLLCARIEKALELGITTFDHADIYGGFQVEEIFGRALKQSSGLRQKMQLITKTGICFSSPQRPEYKTKHYNTSALHIEKSVETSLKNFGTDYLDLLLIHRPDPFMNHNETGKILDKLVKDGKVGFVGVSNFRPFQVDLLQSAMSSPLVTNQIEFSLKHTAPLFDGEISHAQQKGYGIMAWSPLASGALLQREKFPALHAVCAPLMEKYGLSLDSLLLAWITSHPAGITPVVGTSQVQRLASYLKGAQVTLDRQDWFALLEAARGYEVP